MRTELTDSCFVADGAAFADQEAFWAVLKRSAEWAFQASASRINYYEFDVQVVACNGVDLRAEGATLARCPSPFAQPPTFSSVV